MTAAKAFIVSYPVDTYSWKDKGIFSVLKIVISHDLT